jgi:tetratricopeptide (TPR) repeat protein
VLVIFRQAEQAGYLKPPLVPPFLYHLTAVAAMRLGDEAQARRHWQQALKIDPNFSLAQANLADLDQPVYQRHAPWPFEMGQWVSQKARTDMIKLWQPAVRRGSDEAMTRATLRYLQLHPEMLTLVPLLLERGDPGGREFAINLASLAETPELLAALRDFALSQHGPDKLRHRALQIVSKAKSLPPGPIRLWLRGQWSEVISMGFEIYEEPVETNYPPQVGEWYRQAIEALYENDPVTAERLLKQALAVRPDAPGLVNNLAVAYGQLGRKAEAEALLRQNYRNHSDYFFGIIGMAGLYVNEGKFEQAETLLKPLLSLPRLHITEFAALCMAHIQLYHAKKMPEAVQTWLDMWTQIDPDNSNLHYWQRRTRQPQQPSNLFNWRKLLGR